MREAEVDVPAGADGEPGATLEISPLYATTAEQLKQRRPKVKVTPAAVLYFDSSGVEGSA